MSTFLFQIYLCYLKLFLIFADKTIKIINYAPCLC